MWRKPLDKPDNILVKHYAGSISYGTNLPSSDVDFRGIYCDPPRGIVTPWSKPRTEQWESPVEEDTVITELHKYMIGYMNGSPNVLETLWVDRSDIVQGSEVYDYLRSMAPELLSKKLRYTFGGYALGQMKRIKGHNKWINNPKPKEGPVRSDYFKLIQNFKPSQIFARDFSVYDYNIDHLFIPYGNDIYGIVYVQGGTLFNDDKSIRKVSYETIPDDVKKMTPEFVVKLCEDIYKFDKDMHSQYWKWRRERNVKRSELEENHGYDTKHAMHIVRLMRMGSEVLETGVVNVKRGDAQELLDIRAGKWSYNELMEWSEHTDAELDILVKTSDLPDKPDLVLAAEVLIKAEEMARDTISKPS